jgi:hypothetical protein
VTQKAPQRFGGNYIASRRRRKQALLTAAMLYQPMMRGIKMVDGIDAVQSQLLSGATGVSASTDCHPLMTMER